MDKPETNFVFVRPKDSLSVYEGLKTAGILVRRMGDYLRITAGSEAENARLAEAIRHL